MSEVTRRRRPVTLLAAALLSLVALAQLLRLVLRVEVVVGGNVIPLWVSVIGVLVPGTLAFGLWREGRST